MLAKLKWVGEDFGRWRLEGRTVVHKSWSGVVWRRKASAMAYTAACRFAPPLAVVVAYLLEVRATPAPTPEMFVTIRRLEDDAVVAVHTHREVGPYPTVEVLFNRKFVYRLDREGLRVWVECWFDSILEQLGLDYFLSADVEVPPYNGIEPPTYPGLIHTQTLVP
jgi:hypothetical protein